MATITIKPTIKAVEFSPLYNVTEHTGQKKTHRECNNKRPKDGGQKSTPFGVVLLTTKQGIMTHSDP